MARVRFVVLCALALVLAGAFAEEMEADNSSGDENLEDLAQEFLADEEDEAAANDADAVAEETKEKTQEEHAAALKALEAKATEAAQILEKEGKSRKHSTQLGSKKGALKHTPRADGRTPVAEEGPHHEASFAGCRCLIEGKKAISVCSEGPGVTKTTEECSKESNAKCDVNQGKNPDNCVCKPPAEMEIYVPFKNLDLPLVPDTTKFSLELKLKGLSFLTFEECKTVCSVVGGSINKDAETAQGSGCGFDHRQVWKPDVAVVDKPVDKPAGGEGQPALA